VSTWAGEEAALGRGKKGDLLGQKIKKNYLINSVAINRW
jgi:hypothetical protein